MSYIYVITNDINGKQYVGKTNWTIEKRFKEHIKDSKNIQHKKRPLYNAMNYYGIEHFSIKQLEKCNESIVNEREQYWIQKLNTYNNGYNATLGGDSKHYYNYKEIADKYLELQNQKETAEYFKCDRETVKVACEQYNIKTISAKEVTIKKIGKPVYMLDKNTLQVLKEFNSIGEVYRFLNKKVNSHISDVCNGKNKTAYGYKWKWK